MTEFAYTIFQISFTKYTLIAFFILWIFFIIYTVSNNPEQLSFWTVIGSMVATYVLLYGLLWLVVSHLTEKESYENIGIIISIASYPIYHIFYYLHRLKRLQKKWDYVAHNIADGFKTNNEKNLLIVGSPGTGKTSSLLTPVLSAASKEKEKIYMDRDGVKKKVCQAIDNIPDCAGITDCYTEHSYCSGEAVIKIYIEVKEETEENIVEFHNVAHDAFNTDMGFMS